MKSIYLLSLPLLFLTACGADGSNPVVSTVPQTELTANMTSYLDDALPDYKKICVDDNMYYVEGYRNGCLDSMSPDYCQSVYNQRVHTLNHEWDVLEAQVRAQSIACAADFRSSPQYCFGLQQETLARKSSECGLLIQYGF